MQALDLLEGVAVVVRQAGLGVAVAGGVVGDHAERGVGRFCGALDSAHGGRKGKRREGKRESRGMLTGELVHLPPEQDLGLHLLVADGVLVEVLEDDDGLGHFAFDGRSRGALAGGGGGYGRCFALGLLER